MRFIRFNGAGGNEVVSLESGGDPVPGARQVLVAARYTGVNPADVLQRNGTYPVPADAPQDVPGLEVSGTVAAVGPLVRKWKVGDRVMGLVGGGGLADRVVAEESHLFAAPENLDERDASAQPEAVLTAFDALTRTRVATGDLVVVRGVNGGVGIAACQIADVLGANALGIGRTPAALKAVSELGVAVVDSEEATSATLELGGADAVIDLIGGSAIVEDFGFLNVGARVLVVSTTIGTSAEVPLNLLMAKRADLMGTALRGRSVAEKAALVAATEKRLARFLGTRVRVPVDAVFSANDATDAFDHLSTPGKVGKVLLDFGQ